MFSVGIAFVRSDTFVIIFVFHPDTHFLLDCFGDATKFILVLNSYLYNLLSNVL